VHAFEPNPVSFACLEANAQNNGVANRVHCYNIGVSKDCRPLYLRMPLDDTGATTEFRNPSTDFRVATGPSITLPEMFAMAKADHVRLLKVNCMGAEHEALRENELLKKVEFLAGQFHINKRMAKKGFSVQDLYVSCNAFLDMDHMWVACNQMEE